MGTTREVLLLDYLTAKTTGKVNDVDETYGRHMPTNSIGTSSQQSRLLC